MSSVRNQGCTCNSQDELLVARLSFVERFWVARLLVARLLVARLLARLVDRFQCLER